MNPTVTGAQTVVNAKAKPKMARRRWSLGAAYTETVVMIPFFVAVWSGMIFVHKAYGTKVITMAANRHCVYSYAYAGCSGAIAGCAGTSTAPDPSSSETPGGVDSLRNLLGSAGNTLFGALFGATASSRLTRNVDKPRALGGGSIPALASHSMTCNTVRQEPADVLRSIFCGLTPFC